MDDIIEMDDSIPTTTDSDLGDLDAMAALAMDSSDTDEDEAPSHPRDSGAEGRFMRRTDSNRLAHVLFVHHACIDAP